MTRSITLARTLALSALATTVLSSSAFAKIEEGKLVIWINGDKGYNGPPKSARNSKKTPASRSPSSTRTSWKKNTRRWPPPATARTLSSGPTTASAAMRSPACWPKSTRPKPSVTSCSCSPDAVRYDGKLIGYPIAVEALSLIYNKDTVKQPPKTREEIGAGQAAARQRQERHHVEPAGALLHGLSSPPTAVMPSSMKTANTTSRMSASPTPVRRPVCSSSSIW